MTSAPRCPYCGVRQPREGPCLACETVWSWVGRDWDRVREALRTPSRGARALLDDSRGALPERISEALAEVAVRRAQSLGVGSTEAEVVRRAVSWPVDLDECVRLAYSLLDEGWVVAVALRWPPQALYAWRAVVGDDCPLYEPVLDDRGGLVSWVRVE